MRSSRVRGLFVTLALASIGASAAEAQRLAESPWNVHLAMAALVIGHGQSWGRGPELTVQRNIGDRWGLMGRVSAPLLSSDGGGVVIDLGPTLRSAAPDEEIGISLGPAIFPVRENKVIGGVVGGFASIYGVAWLGDHIGVLGESVLRITSDGSSYPGLALGAAFRF